mmetsp:Transcript_24695/g.21862  ORF Transcript_24695/g.21862 Transcript_24695/m.21862 type:complete len:95 (-) Transcript_24695:342-626(-)
MILKAGALPLLCKLLGRNASDAIKKHGAWALSNLVRGRPLPEFEYVKPSIPTFISLLMSNTDAEMLTDCSWALSYLSDTRSDEEYYSFLIPEFL